VNEFFSDNISVITEQTVKPHPIMNIIITCYLIYIALRITLTIWVARTLHKNGRIFLVQAFHGNEQMADSVNHLLVVGFYLVNVGYIALALKYGDKPVTIQEAFEFLSTKIGLVLVVLGGMHFFNMFNFDKMRRKGTHQVAVEPPVITAAR
jgi:hypothetical protein